MSGAARGCIGVLLLMIGGALAGLGFDEAGTAFGLIGLGVLLSQLFD